MEWWVVLIFVYLLFCAMVGCVELTIFALSKLVVFQFASWMVFFIANALITPILFMQLILFYYNLDKKRDYEHYKRLLLKELIHKIK